MKKTTVFLLLTLAIASCYSDVNRPPLSTTDNKQKITTKDKFNFSRKAYSEYIGEDGNYIGDGYGYRPEPLNCNESYDLMIANSPDELISVYVNNRLVLKKSTPRGPEFLYNDDTYLHFYLNDYLNKGKNTIKYEVFNRTGGYSWSIKLYKSTYELMTVASPDENYLINDVSNNEEDTSKEDEIVRTRTLDIYTCKPNQQEETETRFCGTTINANGDELNNCITCAAGYDIEFDENNMPVGCKQQDSTGFNVKYEPHGVDGINSTSLNTGSCQ